VPKRDANSTLVWSSEKGRICPGCGEAVSSCRCGGMRTRQTGDGIVRVRRETKGRGGKIVTVVNGVQGDDTTLKTLAGELKKRCGSGGTVKEGNIEIQGDFCDQIVAELQKKGFSVKRAGG
jgi:translation initiation factor 1